ncbi:MAG: ACT domain-containing protein [Kiritimatiellae bacterium]|jgi:hypothetical protein|nr:ACT domain-containing protein [Kiritimatiellia bacterium]
MKIKQISVYSENKPGQLSAICRALAQADVNITTLSLADTSDFGIVRLIVDDHEKAKAVLSEKGHLVNVKDVLAVCVPDRPGGMAEVMQVLDAAGADIEYSYAFAFHKGEKAVLVFRFADGDLAEKALAQAGVAMLDEKEIAEASK